MRTCMNKKARLCEYYTFERENKSCNLRGHVMRCAILKITEKLNECLVFFVTYA